MRLKTKIVGLLAAATLEILGQLASPAVGAAVAIRYFDIERQALAAALSDFARQSRRHILFSTELVANKETGGIKGEMEPEAALRKLLEGTGLTYRVTADRTILVESAVASAESALTVVPPIRVADGAQASQQAADAKAGRPLPDDADFTRRIEEIVVTAQKREERLQDVPISMSAITADQIDRRGLVNAADYLRGIPGVSQVDSATGQTIVIRGIETSMLSQNALSGTTVATYFGETPTTNSAGLAGGTNVDIALVDVERLEVLRGPQGTAFGNSSMGGAVRTIPVAPKVDRLEGRVAGGYSSTAGAGGNNFNAQAVGNLPLIKDKLAIRAVAYRYEDSGFYRNRAGSDAAFQTSVVIPFGAQDFAVDAERAGSSSVFGGRVAALFQATDDLQFTLGYLSQKTEIDGFALASSGPFEQTILRVPAEHVVRGRSDGASDLDIDIASASAQYSFGSANLVATYSHVNGGAVKSVPFSYAQYNFPWSSLGRSDHREDVGEIRITAQAGAAWKFLLGLYIEDVRDEGFQDNVWYGEPATHLFGSLAPRSFGDRWEKRNLKQRAVFGEAAWEFAPRFTLAGGVRAYEYERSGQVDTNGLLYGITQSSGRTETSDANFKATLSYKPNEAALLYATWSQGFRLGRPQTGLPAGVCDVNPSDGVVDGTSIGIDSTTKVNSDSLDNYELGGKFVLLDRRLIVDADVFRMDWSGMPVSATVPACRAFTYLANAGKAVSEGIEVQATFQVSGPLRIDVGGSWLRARLTEDLPDLPVPAFADDRLPGSPQLNANLGLEYEFTVGRFRAFARADSIYVGSFYGDLQQTANLKTDEYIKLDVSTRVAIGSLNFEVFVRNVTDEDAFTHRGAFNNVDQFYGYRLRPRTVGLQLSYTF